MEYDAWRFWVDIGWKIGTVATLLFTLWANRKKVTAKRFEDLEKKVATMASSTELTEAGARWEERCERHKARTRQVENTLLSMPSRPEISGLSEKMDRLTQNLGRLEGRLEGINRVADLMNEFLIHQGGKG